MYFFSKQLRALIACMMAATLWGVFWFPLRLLEQQAVSGLWATVGIYLFALLGLMPFLRRIQKHGTRWSSLIFLGLFSGWTNLAFILAMLEGTVLRGLLLFYLSPLWTIVLGRLMLKEPIKTQDYFNLILGLSGAVILLWSTEFKDLFSERADWYALSAGFAFALNNIYIRKIGDIPIVVKMLSAWVGVLSFAVVGIFTVQVVPFAFSYHALFIIALVGTVGMTLMTFTAQYGVTHLPVNQSAILFLFEVPVGAISAALWAEEIIMVREYIGGFFVVCAALLTAQSGLKESSND